MRTISFMISYIYLLKEINVVWYYKGVSILYKYIEIMIWLADAIS